MRQRDMFMQCHPMIPMTYFLSIVLVTVFVSHPVVLIMSFCGALLYDILLQGTKRVFRHQILYGIPMLLAVALINPAFSHYGVTTLFYMKTGPVTLEAVVYGIVLAGILMITLLWFANFNQVMTTDKIIYLFGKILPAFSLILSMVCRLVPRFTNQLHRIRQGQRSLGRADSKPLRRGVAQMSILVTWALENSIDTADSMNARGYGLRGRTAFSQYRFDRRDAILAGGMALLLTISILGFLTGNANANYNPIIDISGLTLTLQSVMVYLAWGLYCLSPALMRIWENHTRKYDRTQRKPWYFGGQDDENS